MFWVEEGEMQELIKSLRKKKRQKDFPMMRKGEWSMGSGGTCTTYVTQRDDKGTPTGQGGVSSLCKHSCTSCAAWLQGITLWWITVGFGNTDVSGAHDGMKNGDSRKKDWGQSVFWTLCKTFRLLTDLKRQPVSILPQMNFLIAWLDVCLNSYFIWFINVYFFNTPNN